MYVLSFPKANTNKLRDNEVLSCTFMSASLGNIKKGDQRTQYLFWQACAICSDQLKLNTLTIFLIHQYKI